MLGSGCMCDLISSFQQTCVISQTLFPQFCGWCNSSYHSVCQMNSSVFVYWITLNWNKFWKPWICSIFLLPFRKKKKLKEASYSQISWKFPLCSLVTYSKASKEQRETYFQSEDSSIFKGGIKMLHSLKEISIVELWRCREPREVICFITLPPGRTTTKLSWTHFCLYLQVKSYYNPWQFGSPNDKKIPLIQQLASLFQAMFDKAKFQQETF